MESASLASHHLNIPPTTASQFGVTSTFITTPIPNDTGGSQPATPASSSPSQTGTELHGKWKSKIKILVASILNHNPWYDTFYWNCHVYIRKVPWLKLPLKWCICYGWAFSKLPCTGMQHTHLLLSAPCVTSPVIIPQGGFARLHPFM